MAFADKFKAILKNPKASPAPVQHAPELAPAQPPPSHTLQEVESLLNKERAEGDAQMKALEKEIQAIRGSIEKSELAAKNQRDAHQQALQFLQQDAERELRFLERKLAEDSASWSRQLGEREKAIEQAAREIESGRLERQAAMEKESETREASLGRTEELLKEQETLLAQERQAWREAVQAKDAELLALRQDFSRREAALEAEFKEQETQRRAAQELWQTRLKELERQWTDKRKAWEEAMKAKEEERLRVHATFQERQAAWQLDQERRLQEMARRQERAAEKVEALKAHITKEAQVWHELVQGRDEQVQQIKVKLLLSESETKSRAEQAQKSLQETVAAAAAQAQAVQTQLQEEQQAWKRALETKDAEMAALQEDIRTKLRQLEASYSQRLSQLNVQKEALALEVQSLQDQYRDRQAKHEERLRRLKDEQAALEQGAAKRLEDLRRRGEEDSAALQNQILKFEGQKTQSESDLETLRRQWQEQLVQRDAALKEAQTSLAPQEAEMRKRLAAEEETYTRQTDALKARQRALERDAAKLRESAEHLEIDHRAAFELLQRDSVDKEEALKKRSSEQIERLGKRLDERRTALEAFLAMKKDEETRIQTLLRTREKERADIVSRLENLPQVYEQSLAETQERCRQESDAAKERIGVLEKELAEAREASRARVQTNATALSALRQTLDQKHKELSGAFRSREQMLESERAAIEKQLGAAQTEIDRVRAHWQAEIEKKEQEIVSLQQDMRRQEIEQRQAAEQQAKALQDQLVPLEKKRQDLAAALEREALERDEQLRALEKQAAACQSEIHRLTESAKTTQTQQEERFIKERAAWMGRLEALKAEQEKRVAEAIESLAQKTQQYEQLEEQMRAQTVSFETRKREALHQATVRSRTLQELIQQIEQELKSSQERFPEELRIRQEMVAQLNEQLIAEQERHEKLLARYARAEKTLLRRGQQKETQLQAAITRLGEEWSKKLSARDAEIAAIQTDLLTKETERQGELDRLAKQFAEERFQLEKTKEELDWKLKDQKEVSERQLAGKQKEIQFLENEQARLKAQRDEQVAQKMAAYAAEKQKWQAALSGLQKRLDGERKAHETTLASKEEELQKVLTQSKQRLQVLGGEFAQKVNSWRATNDTLRAQIEQIRAHLAQSNDHWEALKSEKTTAIAQLRQEAAQWDQKLQNDLKELERVNEEARAAVNTQAQTLEKAFQAEQAAFRLQIAEKDERMGRAVDDITDKESASERQWQAGLEQCQTDKQALQTEKNRLDAELTQLQNRSARELRDLEDAIAKLRMEITFKEGESTNQRERVERQAEKELQPLRERLAQMSAQHEQEKQSWRGRLSAKEEDLKTAMSRLQWREKRLQDERTRREKELAALRQQVQDELQKTRAVHETECRRVESLLEEKRTALAELERQGSHLSKQGTQDLQGTHQGLEAQRLDLERSVERLLGERVELQKQFETLFEARDQQLIETTFALDAKERELDGLRAESRRTADELRKKLDQLRRASQRETKSGPNSAQVWSVFETGVQLYGAQRWLEAIKAFETCLVKDPQWGAAYQYLALAYHAQGDDLRAAAIARQALEMDPANPQLGAWVDRLQGSLDLTRKAS